MNMDEALFFDRMPPMRSVYAALRERLVEKYPVMRVKVDKTQISFRNRHLFAMVSLPLRRMKGAPEVYMLVSFGVPYRLDSPRIVQAVEPYPNRWTHHVPVAREEDLDAELMGWLDAAFHFSMAK
ncbi:MAG: hypothetical protein GX592_01145 [Clostridiales bacterium]|nr:hypothetical protein [Clostridiales bacterium]